MWLDGKSFPLLNNNRGVAGFVEECLVSLS